MFGKPCSIIGVIHVAPLPGAAGYGGRVEEIVQRSLADAVAYRRNGVDALIVENMHDVPYLKGSVEPETTAAMTVVAHAVKRETGLPLGVQLLAGANLDSLAVAIAADLDFIRVEGFVYAHIGDEGIHEACAAQLVRRRANLRAEKVKIFADIKKKHSAHAITADVDISETALAAQFFKADGVIVTGAATGHAPVLAEVESVKASTSLPVLIGSGVTADNINVFARHADALIVGTFAKRDGCWENEVDGARVCRLVEALGRVTA